MINNPIILRGKDSGEWHHGPKGSAPGLGEHTDEVLKSLGLSEEEVQKAKATTS